MHPADVAEFVARQAEELRRAIAGRPELAVCTVELCDDVQLSIQFTYQERHLVQQGIDTHVALAGVGGLPAGVAVNAQHNWRVVDLGVRPTTRRLILHMDCTEFDGQPPTANLLQEDGSQLPAAEWPHNGNGEGIITGHWKYDRPFFCRPGLREYHEHVQHLDEPWDRYREAMSLSIITIGLLEDLHERWLGRL